MSWVTRISGGRLGKPKASAGPLGFFWKQPGESALAAGSDWNQDVARDSFRRDAIKRVVGGTQRGVDIVKAATCAATESRGRLAVQITMDGTVIGWIPDDEAIEFHAELQAIAPGGQATVKAHISAGSEGADYRVRLSVARPLRLRTA